MLDLVDKGVHFWNSLFIMGLIFSQNRRKVIFQLLKFKVKFTYDKGLYKP